VIRYQPQTEVDFVIVGSGGAGGILAKELSVAGHSVVVLEQGPWLDQEHTRHDEFATQLPRVGLAPYVLRSETAAITAGALLAAARRRSV